MVRIDKMGRIATPVVAGVALAIGAAGCTSKPGGAATKAESPSKISVVKLPTEGDLVAVTLTPEAEARLGIVTVPIEFRAATRARTFGGDVIVPPGHASIVAAPQTGTLAPVEGGTAPVPGLAVKKGQAIFTLYPILSAERILPSPVERFRFEADKAAARGALDLAKPRYDQAKVNLDRLEGVFRQRITGVNENMVADARNAHEQAKAGLDAAEKQWAIYSRSLGDGADDASKLAPLPLRSPADGVLINVTVQAGQQVTAGSVLFEVANLDPVNVRVPIFVGEESTIATDRDAAVGGLADAPGSATKPAKPVRSIPSANALTTTVDLYYEVENHDGRLRPGQKVGITLPLKGDAESLVVSKAAVLRDSSGGAWVYEAMGKHVFARRRVVVAHVNGLDAVLSRGPKPGTKVVTDGAAELFGTEFGGGK